MLLAQALEATARSTTESGTLWPSFLRPASAGLVAENARQRRRVQALEKTVAQLESQVRSLHQFALLGTMTAEILHDLAAPLTCVAGHRGLLCMGEVSPAHRANAEAMGRGIDRLRALTALLLSFLRRGGGPHRPLRLEDVVERALAICAFVIMKKSISVVRLIPEDLPPIRGDAPLIEGVVINLVHNAVRAMSLGGHLRLEARRASGGVELLVADDGKGIDPEIMERLFEPLTTSRPNSDGRGIGLAFAREVLEQHGGALTVDTVRGKGTTFFVWLPETPGR